MRPAHARRQLWPGRDEDSTGKPRISPQSNDGGIDRVKVSATNELLTAIMVGGLLGVFTTVLFSLPVVPPHLYNPIQQDHGS